jgi:hypothetical protein
LRAPRLLYAILAGVSFALAALAWLLGGIDTALGALLGSALVAINLAGTVLFVRVVLRDRKYKALLLASNLVKFGLTMVVLYLAIVRFNISAIGIVTGLSSMLVASLIYAAARPAGS